MKSWIPYAISAGICALAVPIVIWLLKSKFKRKIVYVVATAIAVCVICEFLIYNVPFPITSNKYYASPDEIYYQTTFGTDIQAVVEGEESVLVFADNNGNYYSKTDKGYQLLPNGSVKEVFSGTAYFGIVSIYRYLDSNDYYVTATVTESMIDGNIDDITDNKGSEFQQALITKPDYDNVVYVLLTCVHDIDDYSLIVDGVEYKAG